MYYSRSASVVVGDVISAQYTRLSAISVGRRESSHKARCRSSLGRFAPRFSGAPKRSHMTCCRSAGSMSSAVHVVWSGTNTYMMSVVGPATTIVPYNSISPEGKKRRLDENGSRAKSGSVGLSIGITENG